MMLRMRLLLYALLIVGTVLSLHAQTLLLPPPNTPLPEFEVATIKPASVDYLGVYVKPGGRVLAGNCTVLCLAMDAFNAPQSRISGAPEWAKKIPFDIDALPPDDSPSRRYNPPGMNSPTTEDQRLMLQALLRDRFKFRYHIEKVEQTVLFLRRSGKPLKLNPPKDPTARAFMSVKRYFGDEESGEIEGVNTPMTYTAHRLSDILERTVVDQTGLPGAYDFHVNAPDERNADITNATLEGMKSLGLQLKAGRAPIDTIVIDEVSKPTPN